jgi:hypothetical protein
VVVVVGSFDELPALTVGPAPTSAMKCGALTGRQRSGAASISLNAIAGPAAPEPGP